MRAATIVETDGTRRLTIADHDDLLPGSGELLVKVHAAGLNNADRMQIAGLYPAPPGSSQDIPGLELAGEVISVGPNVFRFKVGDRVMAVVGGGALAELAVVHERTVMPIPDGMGWIEAGAFPEAFTTAHDALVTQCALSSGERVCIHGAAGGVGVAAIQIAAAVGATVIATVRDPSLRAEVEALAPGKVVAVDPASFAEHRPFDVILELVGASNLSSNIAALAVGGRISIIGIGGGGSRGELDLGALMAKRGRIHGSTLRARPLEQKADAARRVETQVLPHVRSGVVRVPIVATYPLDETTAAYERFSAGGKFGKIVVTLTEEAHAASSRGTV